MKNNCCPSLQYSSHLPGSWVISTSGPPACLKSPVYFQVFIFWKAAERHTVLLCKALLRVGAAWLAQQEPRACCSEGTGCLGTWVRGSRILQRYLVKQHIFSDRCFAVQLLPFPLLGQPSTHSRNHRCNLFSLKLGAPFKVCPEKSQHFPPTKMKKRIPT